MLYDSAKMKPLYILKTGKPGSSFAFEIARQIGFPADVLDSAASKPGPASLISTGNFRTWRRKRPN